MSHLFFSGEVLSRACSEALARCTCIAHCQWQRTLRGNTCGWGGVGSCGSCISNQEPAVQAGLLLYGGGFGNGLHLACFLRADSHIPQSSMHAAIAPQCNVERLRASRTIWSSGVSCASTRGPAMQAGLLMCGGFGNGLLLHSKDRFTHPATLHARNYCAAVRC